MQCRKGEAAVDGGQACTATDGSLLPLLARLLSPWTSREAVRALLDGSDTPAVDGRALYAAASWHWCAPMLYEVLRRHRCLDLLPEPVLVQLRADCLENRLRNQVLRTELAELLVDCAAAGIAVVLLKGAATFADDLYGAAGGRTMLDLDLLVRVHQLDTARTLLTARGYEEVADEGRMINGGPTDDRHAHINGYRKPGTPVRVELHYNIAYGQGGRILPADQGWLGSVPATVDGVAAYLLDPTCRLIHNTVHGLIPERDYIRGGIRFWHVLEFAWLAKRYGGEIDWQAWLGAAKKERCTTAFLAWLLLAHDLFAMPLPVGLPIGFWPRVQARRLKGAMLLASRGQNDIRQKTRKKKFSSLVVRLLHRGYYLLHLPAWVWRNVCYAEGWRNVPVRVGYFARKVVSGRSWGKV